MLYLVPLYHWPLALKMGSLWMFAMAGENFCFPGYTVLPAPDQNFFKKIQLLTKNTLNKKFWKVGRCSALFGISEENWTFNFSTTQIFIVSQLSSAAKKSVPWQHWR
jgi:hypothetical protein